MKIFNKIRKDERGAAIVIALGIFALILAIGLNFASESIIKDEIALNLDSKTRAELFSRSAMNRLLAKMTTDNNFENFKKTTGSGDNVDTALLSATINKLNHEGNPETEWIYLYDNSPGTSDSEIIGRLAYSLCNPGCCSADTDYLNYGGIGKLNAAACVDSGVNAAHFLTNAVSEDNITATSIDNKGNEIQGRPGVSVNEIYLEALDNAFTGNTSLLQGLSAINSGNGNLWVYDSKGDILSNGGNWPDIATLLRAVGVNMESDSDFGNRLSRKLTVSSVPDPEAFWIHNIGDDTVDTDELYHRFNLTRTDWDSLSISDFTDQTSLRFNSDDADTDGTSIPWLKNWKDAGGMGSPSNCRNQVIANLIDYCDSDSTATTDDEDNPSYTGNDKTPYINELRLNIDATLSQLFWVVSVVQIDFTDIAVELVNMYDGGPGSVNYTAHVEVSFDFDGVWAPVTKSFVLPVTVSTGENPYAATTAGGPPDLTYYGIGSGDNFRITNLNIKLEDAEGNFCDFSFIETDHPIGNIEESLCSWQLDYEVNDPRQNLLESNWGDPDNDAGTIGSKNDNCSLPLDPADNTDTEPGEDNMEPWDISTAYIRNAPMKSPWELGFIHRGNTWQTINLKKYNATEGATSTAGGSSYSDGDANILDQIKMTSRNTTLGKVNLNNPVQDEKGNPLIALFTGINVGVKLENKDDNPGYPAAEPDIRVTAGNAAVLSEAVQDKIMTPDDKLNEGNMFKTRAQVLKNITEFSDNSLVGLTQDNDAKQEEIIGKFMNLTKADGKKYDTENMTVLLIAQAIKDVGGVKLDGKTTTTKGKFDKGKDVILSTTQALATLSKNPETDKWEIVNFEYTGN